MVVAQLLPKREFCGSNRVINKKIIEHLIAVNCIEKKKIKKKRQI